MLVEGLPLLLVVDDATLSFNVSHTDLHPLLRTLRARDRHQDQATLQERLLRLDSLPTKRADPALWSRKLAFELDDKDWSGTRARLDSDLILVSDTPVEVGLALTYVGHTPAAMLRLYRSRLFIDRGAVYANGAGSKWRLALLEHREVANVLGALVPQFQPRTLADYQAWPAHADIDVIAGDPQVRHACGLTCLNDETA